MNKIELLDKIRGELVISCQAFEGNPFYGVEIILKRKYSKLNLALYLAFVFYETERYR